MEKRIDNVKGAIENAINAALVEEFPEIETGDVDPLLYINFQDALHDLLVDWAEKNGSVKKA